MLERISIVLLLLFLLQPRVRGQNPEPQSSPQGFTFEGRALGSSNSLGSVTRLDTAAGYIFGPHWSVDLGVPFYFLNPSGTTQAAMGSSDTQGLGNVYGQVRLTLANPVLNYVSTITGTAPTGDRDKGLSTGHGTVDWSNYFDHGIGRVTPFGEVGVANAVSDTQFFVRPYTSYGFVTHAQGGARYRLARWLTAGASAYVIEPSGQQTVISRVTTVRSSSVLPSAVNSVANGVGISVGKGIGNIGNGVGNALGLTKRVFETQSVTTGPADIARDHGFSTWLLFNVTPKFDFYGGYTRSTRFDLNTVFFGMDVRLRKTLGSFGGL
ncbi:MAG TPA: hypothetical protein VGR73_21960 [Bryobacteraceae bacterium]|nr:hypothetical protein [Bryobacteraceae bacterium]